MKHLKKFNENILQGDFDTGRKEVLELLDELYEVYDDLSNDISSKHWRTTGDHFTYLRKMKEDIKRFTCMTDKELDNDIVKSMRGGTID